MKPNEKKSKPFNVRKFVVPHEIKELFSLEPDNEFKLYIRENNLIIEKYKSGCIFCSNLDDLIAYKNKFICSACYQDLKQLYYKEFKKR